MKSKIFSLKNLIYLLVIGLIFFLDRATKIKMLQHQLSSVDSRIFVNDYLNFELTWNTGIGFGLLNLYITL